MSTNKGLKNEYLDMSPIHAKGMFYIFKYNYCTRITLESKTDTTKNLNFTALTHYHTMLHFDALQIYNCGKHREKRRNCL